MKILSLECSAAPASSAIVEDGNILASDFTNVRLTHSQTLLPMAKALLDSVGLTVSDIDGFAISHGPGSFTGIRIGISAIKGMAAQGNKPCYGVSTLRAIAENFRGEDLIVCAVMDARCNQVYGALFSVSGNKIERLCDDSALLVTEMAEKLNAIEGDIIVAGDGAELFRAYESERIKIAEEDKKYQNAVGVAMAASKLKPVSPDKLMPFYLRLPQAERELKARNNT